MGNWKNMDTVRLRLRLYLFINKTAQMEEQQTRCPATGKNLMLTSLNENARNVNRAGR